MGTGRKIKRIVFFFFDIKWEKGAIFSICGKNELYFCTQTSIHIILSRQHASLTCYVCVVLITTLPEIFLKIFSSVTSSTLSVTLLEEPKSTYKTSIFVLPGDPLPCFKVGTHALTPLAPCIYCSCAMGAWCRGQMAR